MPTPGQIAYRAFLKTDFWKALSAEKKRLVGRCEVCGETRHLQAHHVTYPKDWYDSTLDHLQVLCRKHHKQAHGLPTVQWKRREPMHLYRDDESFNVFAHWAHYLSRRLMLSGPLLKEREKWYLQKAREAHPRTATDGAMDFLIGKVFEENVLAQKYRGLDVLSDHEACSI